MLFSRVDIFILIINLIFISIFIRLKIVKLIFSTKDFLKHEFMFSDILKIF